MWPGWRRPLFVGSSFETLLPLHRHGVTALAVLTDLLAVGRCVIVVVTPEAPGKIRVPDVVAIRPEAHLHLREHIPLPEPIDRANGGVDFVRPGWENTGLSAVERAKAGANALRCRIR